MLDPIGRLIVDSFESVDAAEAYLKAWVPLVVRRAELVDGAGEAFCDLALLGEF